MVYRYDIINCLLRFCGGGRYLEVGSCGHMCFKEVAASVKHDIDPHPEFGAEPTWEMPSDEAFAAMPRTMLYDVVFVDGLHHCDQVARDVHNAMRHLADGGWVVMHDCMPKDESWQVRDYPGGFVSWTGDVWKFQAWLVARFPDRVCTIDTDCGCGLVRGRLDFDVPPAAELMAPGWKDYSREAIGAVPWDEFRRNL